jgi:hypothetical protein
MEDLVRQYCYCMAPFLADVASTAETRARALAEDPAVKTRAQELAASCLAGVKGGRRFAP